MSAGAIERLVLIAFLTFELGKALQIAWYGSGALPDVLIGVAAALLLFNTVRRAAADKLRTDLAALAPCALSLAAMTFALWPLESAPPSRSGEMLQFVGGALMVWSAWTLGTSFTLLPAVVPTVTRGPYRWLRHPLYSSYLLCDLGIALDYQAPAVWSALAIEFAAFTLRAHQEENLLAETSDIYSQYRSKVRGRFVPFIL